jgi:dihydrolipoamide dehydrogenase
LASNGKIIEAEVAVVGAGPGGYAAAFRAADLGMKVVLIDDRPRPGGVCLNIGCIPSKALLHVAEVIATAGDAGKWGVAFDSPKIDPARVNAWKDEVVDRLVGGLEKLIKARKIEYIRGRAVFIDSERLRVEDAPVEIVKFQHAVLASGSQPVMPEAFAKAGPRVMTSTEALEVKDTPARLLVVGGGYIGLELATVYAAMGSTVTVVEFTDGLLPGVDRDLVRPVQRRLGERVESIRLKTKVEAIEAEGDVLKAKLSGDSEETLEVDRALVAIGRRPSTSGLGLENTKIKLDDKGFVRVDASRRTDDPNIYAIGDAAGEPQLAHKATREGIVAAEAIHGRPAVFDPAAIPAVVFTDPEIAWCGLTETQAKAQGINVIVRRFPWGASGRAITLDRTEGVTKIICDAETQRILGVGIAGPGAGDLIAEGVLAMEMGAVAEDLAGAIHPHPTLSETLMEGAELILGSATHLFRPPSGS